ncbi:rare lipoprotein A [Legionella massiliensis]|uniref:Rare lipoprotein A n=1 Tax=Legionella massiliensis TaxID=1034943 RepID=A0A078L2L2_9GAMM|nr:SPOR domain-containing protein [Legionella massiliensis]CDZ78359.1 rare lipoprotein A [Legionella massiliensis]CEE14097.1 rare lipoprotein A [Legionella massiliensis]
MKIVLDERVKHRLIGLAVILSIAAIFAPAVMKKSNQRFDGNVSVAVKLPPKPEQPDVDLVEKKEMFDSVKVAHVELPQVSEQQPLTTLAKAESISQVKDQKAKTGELVGETLALADEEPNFDSAGFADSDTDLAKEVSAPASKSVDVVPANKAAKSVSLATKPASSKSKAVAKTNKVTKVQVKPAAKPAAKKVVNKAPKNGYAVQLATFSSQINANSLISKLKNKGYKATYNKVKTNEGIVYKVLVGQLNKKEQAQRLQQQLASAVQIRGFIVTTGEG